MAEAEHGVRGRDAARGGMLLLAATGVAGGLGYVMNPLAGLLLSSAEYAQFAVAWASVFGLAGALAGVQQEVARTAAPGRERRPTAPALVLAVAAAPTIVALVAALVVEDARGTLLCVALAALGVTALLVAQGFAYAAHAWRLIASTMVLEAFLRLVLLSIALLSGAPAVVVTLALVLPFALTVAIVAGPVRRASSGLGLGTPPRAMAANLARTVVATTATAVLVSGFPLFLSAAAEESSDDLGAFLFSFTLTRAPFVIVFLALQSFLVKAFQSDLERVRSRLLGALGTLVAVVLVVAVLAALVGPAVLGLFGEDYVLDGWTLLWIVASAAPMSVLAVTGPLVLAAGLRTSYALGWIVAAAIAVVGVLLVPGPLVVVALVAISAGPLVGATAHLVAFLRR